MTRLIPDLHTLRTPRLLLRVIGEQAASDVLDYYRRNRLFHQPWFPSRPESLFTLRQQQQNLTAEREDFQAGRAVPFWLSLREDPARIIGRLAFTHIIYGSLKSAFLAWHLDQGQVGRGLATEAGQAGIRSMFQDFGLHRIEADILPDNVRSIALARRLGFELEGIAPRFLQINGRWLDHQRYVLLSDGPLWPESRKPFSSAGPSPAGSGHP